MKQSLLPILIAASLMTSGSSMVRAMSAEDRLEVVDQSMQLCLIKASRPGFPYYDRPEARESCNEAKKILKSFWKEANHNRNLACSTRIAGLDFDIWLIEFLGGVKMKTKVLDDLRFLRKNCFNMNSNS